MDKRPVDVLALPWVIANQIANEQHGGDVSSTGQQALALFEEGA